MRARPSSLLSSLLLTSLSLTGACKAEQPQPELSPTEPATKTNEPATTELGGHASEACTTAMAAFTRLDALAGADAKIEPAKIRAAWTGPLHAWVAAADQALGREDAALIDESLARLEDREDPHARRRELLLLVTQIRTAAMFETRRLLTAASDADLDKTSPLERTSQWDDAWTIWSAALRPLASRADALPKRGGEDWEHGIAEAFAAGRDAADDRDPITPKASRQIIEKGGYAIAYRLILAAAEDRQPLAIAEASALLDMLDDRIADRNGPGLKRMRRMLNGDPAAVDPALIERELAVAFCKRARKYCDKAVAKAELGTPGAIAETWEGVIYTRVILPSMRDALSDAGFDADAYAADWQSYLEAVEGNDTETAAAISARLVEWNCAYQDRLGIAECTSSADEPE